MRVVAIKAVDQQADRVTVTQGATRHADVDGLWEPSFDLTMDNYRGDRMLLSVEVRFTPIVPE